MVLFNRKVADRFPQAAVPVIEPGGYRTHNGAHFSDIYTQPGRRHSGWLVQKKFRGWRRFSHTCQVRH